MQTETARMDRSEQDWQNRGPSRKDAPRMFDRIAHRYDLLNCLLSFGRDRSWRREVAKRLNDRPVRRVLDLATGTADLLLSVVRENKQIEYGVGLDAAGKMLAIGQSKIASYRQPEKLSLVRADALSLPFVDRSFDAVTIAFGIRNLLDVTKGLAEMRRILTDGGRAVILEFSLPSNRFIRRLYLIYFRHILPFFGSIISGDSYAYRYLDRTVESFPYGTDFCRIMKEAGFRDVTARPLTFGVATIYEGVRLNDRMHGDQA
jgi:demethylmenaquinone methyltransferase/2-methoxy-6-polyprenyl-1,4-benzoquinol methylase